MKRFVRKRHKIKQKKSTLKKPFFWLVILALIAIAIGVYFFIFFDGFQVKKIIISGNEKISTNVIKTLVSEKIKKQILFLSSKSIFLASPAVISSAIIDSFPEIGYAQVKRKLTDTLIIDIKERVPSIVLCGENKTETCFFVDEAGVAFEKTVAIPSKLPIVRQSREETVLGKEAIKKDIVGYIIKIQKNLSDNFNVDIKGANIISDERMNVLTNEGWEVYFNLASDIDLQITKLKLLLEKEIPQGSRGELKYIDLRFNRAYYK